ncbi:hypothetical protein [Streptomyces sp. NBC_00893]|uniref:hypothetical protein n=1 Tax=Streptomyces sp. NBC_00893 TaxID=2975862 RepID=UPI00224E3F45|nr:hypothetical protein [Streptomyces sp. NBC_00893]MCX4850363.1 hypothetical protein [Streptomyces sp. NBC_00893]
MSLRTMAGFFVPGPPLIGDHYIRPLRVTVMNRLLEVHDVDDAQLLRRTELAFPDPQTRTDARRLFLPPGLPGSMDPCAWLLPSALTFPLPKPLPFPA